jgi:hypothetical protein
MPLNAYYALVGPLPFFLVRNPRSCGFRLRADLDLEAKLFDLGG